jgi:hypothetical protein
MDNLSLIEDYFQSYKNDLVSFIPEDIISVDLSLLQQFELLNEDESSPHKEASLSHSFQIIESDSKMTLINSQFLIWITSEKIDGLGGTWTLIALNGKEQPHLELAFHASGIYNYSRLVLRILEKFLNEIEENENLIQSLKR